MSKNILAIYPHPDDETIIGAGTLRKHVKAGDKITLVCATLGQNGTPHGSTFFC
ncbi:PIG-L deacetylase family protein [Pseudogracilibacillus auburnensis]|uniref:GlcNAc-PI de-N-acetylase n=1 Tax=Pseudogracilibacillus auburnensis TaxID=1494959 RepID=A0A2V3W8A0_9BACI|nr:PIG-L family deacetylase [Pseudogracilibacillus auburnensis]MBO1001146.1 PIG-L family deacetylase [Pseudogracilibacillus auburnensis]PXW90577.1 GlcNAc-PI de-N-acetylase [Pseudogracilibacillus auburnensis]